MQALREQQNWEKRAKDAKELLNRMLKSRKENAELAQQHDIKCGPHSCAICGRLLCPLEPGCQQDRATAVFAPALTTFTLTQAPWKCTDPSLKGLLQGQICSLLIAGGVHNHDWNTKSMRAHAITDMSSRNFQGTGHAASNRRGCGHC